MNLEHTTSHDELLVAHLPEMRVREMKQPAPSSILSTESASAYPQLTSSEMSEISVFGELTCFAPGDCMVESGESQFDSFVILSGQVRVVDSTAPEAVVFTRYGTGCFTGDVDLLTGLCSVITVEAETDVLAFRLTSLKLRELFVRRPVLGDKIWRAFRHRRALLIKSPFRGLSIYGSREDPATLSTIEFLSRNMVPHEWVETGDLDTLPSFGRLSPVPHQFPVIARGRKVLLEKPSRKQLAERLGLRRSVSDRTFDVTILGAGPAGLGSAVYAASEGLSTLVLDATGPGGQAGASSRIENYAGFPNGIAGGELAYLTYLQAIKFGAEFSCPSTITAVERGPDGDYILNTAEGDAVRAKCVVISTGVSYRLLHDDGNAFFNGPGVYYSATQSEASRCDGQAVHIIGGGNSAGQAAMYLSQYAERVTLVLRGSQLHKSMSSYLVTRLLSNRKIRVLYDTQVVSVFGEDYISSLTLRTASGDLATESTSGLFVFIGARPRTDFIARAVARDESGYILTGNEVVNHSDWQRDRCPLPLETSSPGIFAAGDCRTGTAKRVASAIGDGALAVTCVHQYLDALERRAN